MRRFKGHRGKLRVRTYAPAKRSVGKIVRGTFTGNARGFGFVTPLDAQAGTKDVFVPVRGVKGALHGDLVEIRAVEQEGGLRPEGTVIDILERGTKNVIGTYHKEKGFGLVVSDDRRFNRPVLIPRGKDEAARDGQKVSCEIVSYGARRDYPTGEITEILGDADEAGLDIFAIAKAMGLPMEFSERHLRQAERTPDSVLESDLAGREDFRNQQIITIDGPDAKDLDDAVSLVREGDGFVLGVHIADVSHYVPESSALDREALKRGTSVYLADRVIPMLPEKLSNGICSLNPGVDRLTLSVIMHIDDAGEVSGFDIVKSVIRVTEKMTYPDVRAILTEEPAELMERYSEIVPLLRRLYALSKILRAKRIERGAIDFHFPEAKIEIDESGRVTGISARSDDEATRIIEECMLAANETVAAAMFERKVPFVYRVHGEPDPEKIEEIFAMMKKAGVDAGKAPKKPRPKAVQKALERAEGTPIEGMVQRLFLRSMQQAHYSTECEGHYGLAVRFYTHFTSPIRRYPDLQIHRIIKEVLFGDGNPRTMRHFSEILPDVALSCSQTERRAAEVERETEDCKKAQYMAERIGEEFVGTVVSVGRYGADIELDNTVRGELPIETLRDDYYEYRESELALVGRLKKRRIRLGDKLSVVAAAADAETRSVGFVTAEEWEFQKDGY